MEFTPYETNLSNKWWTSDLIDYYTWILIPICYDIHHKWWITTEGLIVKGLSHNIKYRRYFICIHNQYDDNITESKTIIFRKLYIDYWSLAVSPDTCANKFPLLLMGDWAEGQACAYPGARTPIGQRKFYTYNEYDRM